MNKHRVLIFYVLAAIFCTAFCQTYADIAAYNQYKSALTKDNGALINYIYTSRFAKIYDRHISVAIDESAPEEIRLYIKRAYLLLSDMMGRKVVFVEPRAALTESAYYVYVSPSKSTILNDNHLSVKKFTNNLKLFVKNLYADKTNHTDPLWAFLNNRLTMFSGMPLFFNNEIGDINYHELMIKNRYHFLKNTNIEKTAVYVNTSDDDYINYGEYINYTKYVSIQEIFQGLFVARDIFDSRFQNKTILYDHDQALDGLKGRARRLERIKHTVHGICKLDAMLAIEIGNYGVRSNASLGEGGVLSSLYAYMASYYYHYIYDDSLFDSKCW